MKIEKEPLKDEEVPSGVNGVEITACAPMETDAPENEGPMPLRRIATDVEMHDLTITTTSAIPNADTDSKMHPYTSTTPNNTLHIPYRINNYRITNHNVDTRILLLSHTHSNSTYALRRCRQALHIHIPRPHDTRSDDRLAA
jgi:hypothetical protein